MIFCVRSAAIRLQAALVVAVTAVASPLYAQSRFEIGAAATWTSGGDAGGTNALLTRNPATGSSPFVLFDTSSRVNAAPGAAASIAFSVTPRVSMEGTAEFSRPLLRTTIGSDAEGATGSSADSRLTSFVVGGSIVYRFGLSRLAPFAFGGAGWSRQLDEDRIVLITGPELHAGGGAIYQLTRKVQLRGDVVASSRERVIAFDRGRHIVAALSVGIRYRF